jgi:hypothetical protein
MARIAAGLARDYEGDMGKDSETAENISNFNPWCPRNARVLGEAPVGRAIVRQRRA